MAFLYKVLSGTVGYNGVEIKGKMSNVQIPGLDVFVTAGVMAREQINEANLVAASAILTNRFVKKSTTQIAQMSEADASGCIGASLAAGGAGDTVPYLKEGFLAVTVGDDDLADAQNIVAGQGGKAVAYLTTGYTILNEAGIAGDDITQTVWGSAGSPIYVGTSADVEADRGVAITFYFIDDNSEVIEETVTLNTNDSSTQVYTQGVCTVLLGYEPAEALSGTLVITDEDGNTAKSIATPSGIRYGFLAASDTSADAGDTGGHRVKLTCSTGVVTGSIVVEWLTKDGDTVYEIVDFTADASAYTTEAYKYFVGVFIADDGRATATWTATIDANTAGQIVGTTVGAVTANGTALIDFKTPQGQLCTVSMSMLASISQGQTDYMGPNRITEATTEIDHFVVPYDGTIEGLFATLETAASGTNSTALTVRKNGADTDMVVTITGTATSGNAEGSDYAFSVAAGDKICVKVRGTQPTSGYAAANLNATLVYRIGV